MKLSRTDLRLIWATGLILSISGLFMLTNLGGYFFRNLRSGQAVGQFSQWNKDVRHKWNSEFSWRTVNSTGVVEENDYVFAGDESSATVEFYDGFILEVEPQSLIKIEREAQQTVLAFNFGTFNLSGDNQALIVIRTKQGKSKIILSKTAKVVFERKSKADIATMKVVEGTASIEKEGERFSAPFRAGDALNFEVPEATVSQSVTTEARLPDITEARLPDIKDKAIAIPELVPAHFHSKQKRGVASVNKQQVAEVADPKPVPLKPAASGRPRANTKDQDAVPQENFD
jgi:hypothetical protein